MFSKSTILIELKAWLHLKLNNVYLWINHQETVIC